MGQSITIQVTNRRASIISNRRKLIDSVTIFFDREEINILRAQPFSIDIAPGSRHEVIISGMYDLGFIDATFGGFEPLPFTTITEEGQVFRVYNVGSGLYEIDLAENLQ